MTENDIEEAVRAERADLAAMLAALPEPRWDEPTLCAGWRVRELVAHLTMPYRLGMAGFLLGMVRARGDFNRMADRRARDEAARLSPADLVASLRDNIGQPWRPPGGGIVGALSHDVIHGLDASVALGLDRRVPAGRLALIMEEMSPRSIAYFGTDLSGVRLEALDLDWTLGEGEPLRGAAQHLLLVVCGRKLPDGLLSGKPSGRFVAAVG